MNRTGVFAMLQRLAGGLASNGHDRRPGGSAGDAGAAVPTWPAPDHKVTREDVIGAYRYLLGREPENEEVIRGYQLEPSFDALRESFLRSDEFQARLALAALATIAAGRHERSGPMSVELDCSREQLAALLVHISRSWRKLGETEPHWSVLSFERFRPAAMADSHEDFYATGDKDARMIEAFFERAGFDLGQLRSCLEFGCGVGRVTSALAAVLPAVCGVDASAAHLERAQEWTRARGLANIEFVLFKELDDLDRLPPTDLLVSFLVFQHNPPPLIEFMLDRLLARVRPGGFALFQLPTYRPGYRFAWEDYWREQKPFMEMHLLPQARVFARLLEHGFDILEVQEDAKVRDPVFISQTFFARKQIGPAPAAGL